MQSIKIDFGFFKNFFRSIGSIGLAKIFSFLKELSIASYLGINSNYDTFLFYLVTIGTPAAVLINPIQTGLIQKLSTIAGNSKRAQKLGLIYLTNCCAATVITLPIIVLVWISFIYSFDSLKATKEDITSIYFFIPYTILNSINILIQGYLQSQKKFLTNGLIPIANSLIIIIVMLTLDMGINGLLIAITAGSLLELLIYIKLIRLTSKLFLGLKCTVLPVKKVLLGCKNLIYGYFFLAAVPFMESKALFLSVAGELASFNYANKIPSSIASILITSAGVVALPHMTEKIKSSSSREFLSFFTKILIGTIIISTVSLYMLILNSREIIKLVFSAARFSASQIENLSRVQSTLLSQIPLLIIIMISQRTLIALSKHKTISTIMILTSLIQSLLIAFNSNLSAIEISKISFFISLFSMIIHVLLVYLIIKRKDDSLLLA